MSARTRNFSSLPSCQRGFTLVELSIALAVIGIVVAGGLTMTTSMVDRQAYVQTGNQMDEIEKALSAYVKVVKRLPCPANPTLSLESDALFGKEQPCATAANGVAIGMLPVRTLGLRDRMAADEYGNRYTYAVTAAMATNQFETATGRVIIKDGNNNQIVDNAAYAIVSHGGDGKGAYRYETANQTSGCSGGKDAENCNGDATFVNTRFNRGSVTQNWFDDTVRFRQKQLINLSDTTLSELWKENGVHIHNTNEGGVGIGTSMPYAKLHVKTRDDSSALIESTDASYTLKLDSMATHTGLEIGMKSGDAVRAIDIDHVGTDGFGIHMNMNTPSTGIKIEGADATTGIDVDTGGARAIDAANTNTEMDGIGVYGSSVGPKGSGLYGNATGAGSRGVTGTGTQYGVYGEATSENGSGVYGYDSTNNGHAVYGYATGTNGRGVTGVGPMFGVFGQATADQGSGVQGIVNAGLLNAVGVYGRNNANGGFAVYGYATAAGGRGVYAHSVSGYGIWCQATLCGGQVGWNETSDARLKDHVVTLDDSHGLAAIRKLRPVTYSWKDVGQETLGTQLGFIAQEVEAILPEVVSTGDDQEIDLGEGKTETVTKAKSMMYASLTVPLVRAVQQLADQFDALAASVKDLLSRLGGVETKIASLEADNTALKADNAALKESNAALLKRLDAIEAKLAH